ncbi:TPA: LamG domain-containing protein [Candidatus Poribacteria bacterium]|nr:LamG domain-containing protein [Candidatus Poribacteria bacterium]
MQPDNVVLYMPFDQPPTKDTIQDQSEYDNHGTLIGKAKWIKGGKFGGAMEFDGASKIEVPHSKSLNMSKEMTLQIWFKTKLPQKGRFLIYKVHLGGGRNYEWGIYLTGGSKSVSMYLVEPNDTVKWVSKNGDWENNDWHFLVGTYDGKAVKCYIDGEQADKAPLAKVARTSEGSVFIGTWGNNFFTGLLDEARILDVALTEDAITEEFQNGYRPFLVESKNKLGLIWGRIKSF